MEGEFHHRIRIYLKYRLWSPLLQSLSQSLIGCRSGCTWSEVRRTALKKREPNCMNGCAPKDSKFSVSTTVYLQCMDLWKLVFNWLLLVWTAVSLCTIGWKERRARSNRSVWVKDTSRQCQCSDAQLQYSLQKFILFRKININLEATLPWIFPDS